MDDDGNRNDKPDPIKMIPCDDPSLMTDEYHIFSEQNVKILQNEFVDPNQFLCPETVEKRIGGNFH